MTSFTPRSERRANWTLAADLTSVLVVCVFVGCAAAPAPPVGSPTGPTHASSRISDGPRVLPEPSRAAPADSRGAPFGGEAVFAVIEYESGRRCIELRFDFEGDVNFGPGAAHARAGYLEVDGAFEIKGPTIHAPGGALGRACGTWSVIVDTPQVRSVDGARLFETIARCQARRDEATPLPASLPAAHPSRPEASMQRSSCWTAMAWLLEQAATGYPILVDD